MRVVVLGATGEMGSRVARWLRELAPGVEVVGACRSGRGASDVPLRAVDVHDRPALESLLKDTQVVVNVVGPYRWDPDALVAACVAARCHYVDLAEDPEFLAGVARCASAHDATGSGVSLVPGASTAPGLVDLLARHIADAETAGIRAFLSMGSRNPVSPGLLIGLLRPLGRTRPEGGRWFRPVRTRAIGSRRLRFAPYPWPTGDLQIDGRPVPVSFRVGFDRAFITHALSLAGLLLGRLPEAWVERLGAWLAPMLAVARPLGTPLGVLEVASIDSAGSERGRIAVHARERGLDVPALPAAWAALRLLEPGAAPAGVVALSDLIAPPKALEALVEAGYEVVA